MTNTKFTEEMKKLWKGCNPNVLTKVESKLSYYNHQDIYALWLHLSENYTQQSAPSYAHICGYIRELHMQPIKGGVSKKYASLCKVCGTVFRDTQHPGIENCCPTCLSEHYGSTEYDNQKHDVILTQYQCFRGDEKNQYKPIRCVMFGQAGSEGSKCSSWGWQQNRAECKDCICDKCCKKMITENRAEYNRRKQFNAKKLAESKRMDDKHTV